MATTKQKRNSGSGRSLTRTVVEHSALFSGGLNTEISDTADAVPYTSDECNCDIRSNGSRSRRLGIDYENGYGFIGTYSSERLEDLANSATEWFSEKEKETFFVIQKGSFLFFSRKTKAPFSKEKADAVLDLRKKALRKYYITQNKVFNLAEEEVGSLTSVGENEYEFKKEETTLGSLKKIGNRWLLLSPSGVEEGELWAEEGDENLKGYIADTSSVSLEPCRFTEAYGGLFVCSKAIEPFFIEKLPEEEEEETPQTHQASYALLELSQKNLKNERERVQRVRVLVDDSEIFRSNFGAQWYGTSVFYSMDGERLGWSAYPFKQWDTLSFEDGPIFAFDEEGKPDNTKQIGYFLAVFGRAFLLDSEGMVDWEKEIMLEMTDDFFEPIKEPYLSTAEMPTANYYARVWNEAHPTGDKQTAREKTGIKAVAITPYSGDFVDGETFSEYATGSVIKTIDVPEISHVFTCKKEDGKQQREYLLLVTERNNHVTGNLKGEFHKGTYPDGYVYTRDIGSFIRYKEQSEASLSSGKETLRLYIRDFKGCEDTYRPTGATFDIDLRESSNVSIRPVELFPEHLYNLRNRGWIKEGKEDAIDSFAKAIYSDSSIEKTPIQGCFPSNNLQWFILKDEETRKWNPSTLVDKYFGNTPAPSGHYIIDYFTQERQISSGIDAGEKRKIDDTGKVVTETVEGRRIKASPPRCPYVSDIATYAGRIFYLTGDTVLYSQVVLEDLSKAGKCYQEADPTSEEISDIVDSDGGMIQIPEIGEGIKLVHLGGSLAVVGTRSTYIINGGSENNFTATAYVGGALQTYSSNAPFSFVEAEGSVFYWSTIGIIQLSAASGGVLSASVSEKTIQTFYDTIPDKAKERCRGFFDNTSKEIWWVYPGDTNKLNELTKALVLNIKTGCWSKHSFASNNETPYISGVISLKEAFKVSYSNPVYGVIEKENLDGSVKIENQPIVVEVEGSFYKIIAEEPLDSLKQGYTDFMFICSDRQDNSFTFGLLNNLNYRDWAAGDLDGSGYDYESYLVSHPILLQQEYYSKTTPYLLATFRRTEQGFDLTGKGIHPSACQGSIMWDWPENGNSGKWDAQQELYRYDKGSILDGKMVSSKTRVYGSGRALQIRLSSVGNKGFIIENVGLDVYVDRRI